MADKKIDKAIKIIVQNQNYILDKLSKWDTWSPEKELHEHKKEKFKSLLMSVSNIKKEDFINKYLIEIREFAKAYESTTCITDSINVKFLANLLSCEKEEISSKAWYRLYSQTGYKILKDYSGLIKKNLEESKIKAYDKNALLSVLDLTEEERAAIIDSRETFKIKASAGDSDALDSITIQYKHTQNPDMKRLFAVQLMETGRKEGVRAALEEFDSPVYDICTTRASEPCTSSSYQKMIMINLSRYHPYDSLLNVEYRDLWLLLRNKEKHESDKIILAFWAKVRKWVMEKYQVELTEKPPYMNIFGTCGPFCR